MSKKITIIGGGISGLTVLHYLKQKYSQRDDISIYLVEKEKHLGGTINTFKLEKALIESGPNGFLNSKPRTLELIKELSLENALIEADQQAKIRYILKHNRLQPIPTKPQEFFRSSILNPIQKLRLLTEVIQPKKELRRENVYEFAQRRLGKGAADWLIDPMVSGIYGGDAHKIGLSAAFPRMAELEQKYGSLFKAMHALKKTNGRAGPMPNGTLMSFQSGMKQLIDALGQKYKTNITMSSRIKTLAHNGKKYQIYTDVKAYEADEVYCCAPAYATARLFRSLDHVLADDLDSIEYAPIAVVSLVYKRSAFADTPKGFGFLVPSLEKKKLLGVLFDSNIFPNRSAGDQFICRAMVGGIRHPDIRSEKTESLLNYTVSELKTILNIQQEPVASKIILWTEAIPQYTTEYIDLQKRIESRLEEHQNLHLAANYWKGIAFNDCIENAYQAAMKSNL